MKSKGDIRSVFHKMFTMKETTRYEFKNLEIHSVGFSTNIIREDSFLSCCIFLVRLDKSQGAHTPHEE